MLLTFGEHAREHISVESFLHLLDSLLDGSAASRSSGDCAVLGLDLELDLNTGAPTEATQRAGGARLASSPGFFARWSAFVLDHSELHLLGVTNPDGKWFVESSGDYCWDATLGSGAMWI